MNVADQADLPLPGQHPVQPEDDAPLKSASKVMIRPWRWWSSCFCCSSWCQRSLASASCCLTSVRSFSSACQHHIAAGLERGGHGLAVGAVVQKWVICQLVHTSCNVLLPLVLYMQINGCNIHRVPLGAHIGMHLPLQHLLCPVLQRLLQLLHLCCE